MKTVVLLHGLARTRRSMRVLEKSCIAAGYDVYNIGYPSRHYPIEILAECYVLPAINTAIKPSHSTVNFITHSMGGIIVRKLAQINTGFDIGRVVMLAPPNHGSEIVDTIGHWALFDWANGPAGRQLGTDSRSLPGQLDSPVFDVGVIAGNKPLFGFLPSLLPGPNDGKVTIESTRLENMSDFISLSVSHTFMPQSPQVIQQSINFINEGFFLPPDQTS